MLLFTAVMCAALTGAAQSKPAAKPGPDVLVLSNGDTLRGKLVSAIEGKVTFHSDALGDMSLSWAEIKDLRTSERFAVLKTKVKLLGRGRSAQIPVGTVEVENQAITVHPEGAVALAPIPVKDTEFILDEATLNKILHQRLGLLSGWNGSATAGATLVTATQNQYTVSGGFGIARVVPTVSWLQRRNRTTLDFTGSFGKITQPAYVSAGVLVPAVATKSAIYHADAERDQYFSPRFFTLAQTAFDHNFGQDLDLQQIYGGGFGWTVLKTPKQEADLKGTIQYEKQQFISVAAGAPNGNQNLVGSTFSADYVLHLKRLTYTQGVAYIPAFNQLHAYSTNETNTVAFPAYKRLSFSIGTLDSYLNNPPLTEPPTKRNSFQFTMGLSYAFKSKD
ncbi:MAG TPA: DUF481 domain-containing protein [Terracidiphilus sp.]|nr:DUF481 domain-containing protein [Terracidiphilus sp.]